MGNGEKTAQAIRAVASSGPTARGFPCNVLHADSLDQDVLALNVTEIP
jgi:hypothetical protein